MNYEHLQPVEVNVLQGFVDAGQITSRHVRPGVGVGLDSMGPARNPKTDDLFPGTKEAIHRFGEAMQTHNLLLIPATNGPNIEGEDILQALPASAAAFAITEGGGVLIYRNLEGAFAHQTLAKEEDLEAKAKLEEQASKHPFMHAMLTDTQVSDDARPMRTPYETNVVITLPTTFDTLQRRVHPYVGRLEDIIPGIDASNYIEKVLVFAEAEFGRGILEGNLEDNLSVLVKKQNRRIYVMPNHLLDHRKLNKYGGVELASQLLQLWGFESYPDYTMSNSIYIADKVIDRTSDGQEVIGPPERSMVTGALEYFYRSRPDDDLNVVKLQALDRRGKKTTHIAEVACRMAFDVTMSDDLPEVKTVEGVPILRLGSGNKVLEAIPWLLEQLAA